MAFRVSDAEVSVVPVSFDSRGVAHIKLERGESGKLRTIKGQREDWHYDLSIGSDRVALAITPSFDDEDSDASSRQSWYPISALETLCVYDKVESARDLGVILAVRTRFDAPLFTEGAERDRVGFRESSRTSTTKIKDALREHGFDPVSKGSPGFSIILDNNARFVTWGAMNAEVSTEERCHQLASIRDALQSLGYKATLYGKHYDDEKPTCVRAQDMNLEWETL